MDVGSRSQTRSHRTLTLANIYERPWTRNPVTTGIFEQLCTPTDTLCRLRRFWVRILGGARRRLTPGSTGPPQAAETGAAAGAAGPRPGPQPTGRPQERTSRRPTAAPKGRPADRRQGGGAEAAARATGGAPAWGATPRLDVAGGTPDRPRRLQTREATHARHS
jgi:hypothetical protein